MKKITNRELARIMKVLSDNQYKIPEFLDMFDLFAIAIEREVLNGNSVQIFGLGTFYPQKTKAYRQYLGIHKSYVDIPESLAVKFTAGKAIKDRIKDAAKSKKTESKQKDLT